MAACICCMDYIGEPARRSGTLRARRGRASHGTPTHTTHVQHRRSTGKERSAAYAHAHTTAHAQHTRMPTPQHTRSTRAAHAQHTRSTRQHTHIRLNWLGRGSGRLCYLFERSWTRPALPVSFLVAAGAGGALPDPFDTVTLYLSPIGHALPPPPPPPPGPRPITSRGAGCSSAHVAGGRAHGGARRTPRGLRRRRPGSSSATMALTRRPPTSRAAAAGRGAPAVAASCSSCC